MAPHRYRAKVEEHRNSSDKEGFWCDKERALCGRGRLKAKINLIPIADFRFSNHPRNTGTFSWKNEAAIYVNPSKKYLFPREKYLFLSQIYVNPSEKYIFL